MKGDAQKALGDAKNATKDAGTEGGEVIATLKLSRHNERAKRVAAELSDGATYAVSIG